MIAAIADDRTVMVKAFVSNTLSFALVSARQVFAHKLAVFPKTGFSELALLQSNIHEVWARQYGSTMRTDLNYSTTDCFETFAFPPGVQSLCTLGERYSTHRGEVMLANQEGLTRTYNRFHSPDEKSAPVRKLRVLHVEIDEAVKQVYGWENLPLDHGFHETKHGLRYTISEAARVEVLDRLLELNHVRYAEEVKAGLHEEDSKGKAKPKPAAATKRESRAKVKGRNAGQAGLFADGDDE